MSLLLKSLILLAALAGATELTAQRPRPDPPARVAPLGSRDPGVPVEMFESSNLDRFLRKAQDFLAREEYGNAIKVLQDVIEGRTVEFLGFDEEGDEEGEEGETAKEKEKEKVREMRERAAKQAESTWPIDEDDPAYSVFSSDDRLYRPVARLCHELLASMPEEGIGLYRNRFEYSADQARVQAEALSDLPGLEAVYKTYFVTSAAGLAMQSAGDLLMDAGRFRAAIQTYLTLLQVYPPDSRREVGLRDLLLWVKVAICYQQLGESQMAAERLDAVARQWPEASVRIMGELFPVESLAASPLFAAPAIRVSSGPKRSSSGTGLGLASSDLHLVPLWEFRFTKMDPYAMVRSKNNRPRYPSFPGRPGAKAACYPKVQNRVPGTTVSFVGGQVAFLDHHHLVVLDAQSGLLRLMVGDEELLATGDEKLTKPTKPKPNWPRSRVPIYDYFSLRVAQDGDRYFVIEGTDKTHNREPLRLLTDNRLVAYDSKSGEPLWATKGRGNTGRKGPPLSKICFLATPTVHRSDLLMPFLDRGAYGLLCLEAETGKMVYRVYLHSGGTAFARAPASPVKVNSGVAYVLTNAGVVAAIDAHTGVLLWARIYERAHPIRGDVKRPRINSRNVRFGRGLQPKATSFRGFAATDLLVIEDRVILAPCDGYVLLCLNGASGEPLWMLDALNAEGTVLNKMTHIVGHDQDHLYIACEKNQLLCVGIRSGIREWVTKAPGSDYDLWRGRGLVAEGHVVLPGQLGSRELAVFPTSGRGEWRVLKLPDFSVGKKALEKGANLFKNGPYLAMSYEGGVEVYSSVEAMLSLAEKAQDPEEKAADLIHAGLLEEASKVLLSALAGADLAAERRARFVRRFLSLAGEVALLLASHGRREEALAILDLCKPHLGSDPKLLGRWHLARLQVFRSLRDLPGIEREQEIIEVGLKR